LIPIKTAAEAAFLLPEPGEWGRVFSARGKRAEETRMGRGLLLWLIGIPLPIILVVWLLGGLG